jgi:hypothetical protein
VIILRKRIGRKTANGIQKRGSKVGGWLESPQERAAAILMFGTVLSAIIQKIF